MLLNDKDIMALDSMIAPFEPTQVRQDNNGNRVISYGLSSCGYDIRLGKDYKIPVKDRRILSPKIDRDDFWTFEDHETFVVEPGSFVLGVSLERFSMPDDVCGTCVGKSTYARLGLVVNVTPLEPGWRGYLTLELSNTGRNPVRVYAGEGIAQIQFWRLSSRPAVTYADRAGKYQDQAAQPVEAKL